MFFFNMFDMVFDFFEKLLVFNFVKCIIVEEVFKYLYFELYYDFEDELIVLLIFEEFFDFDKYKDNLSKEQLKQLIYQEIMR